MRGLRLLGCALLALLCLWLPSAATAEDAATVLAPGALAELRLSDAPALIAYTPATTGEYGVYLFPVEGRPEAHVELWQEGALLASGDSLPCALTARLSAGIPCTLRLTGRGDVRLEVAREALCRCFKKAMELEGDYSKVIARAGDAHWYVIRSDSAAPLTVLGAPQQQALKLEARLFGADGTLLCEAGRTAGGAFLLDLEPEAGRRYLLRVSAEGNGTGLYGLRLAEVGARPPLAIVLSPAALTLRGRETAALEPRLTPADAEALLFWESSDPTVALVNQAGEVTGLRPGRAVVSAYGVGGASARCRVTVEDVRVEALSFPREALELHVGDELSIQVSVQPSNALNQRISFRAADVGVVEIEGGMLYARAEGETTVTARSLGSDATATMRVTVGPAVRHYRALLAGELNYASAVAASRPGTMNSLNSLQHMLESQSYGGAGFQSAPVLLDAGRDELLAAILDAFGKAGDADLSVLYLTCHGVYADGMTRFLMADGSVLTAAELARALRAVRGEVLVLLDCCGSGGAIGADSTTDDILSGVGAVFGGLKGGAPLATSRLRVLASAALEQDSYRIRYSLADGTIMTSTVFARALCEAGGWDMAADARGPLRADRDYDGAVNMAELYGYLSRRIAWILAQNNTHREDGLPVSAQCVRLWPETDAGPVFARTESAEAGPAAPPAME